MASKVNSCEGMPIGSVTSSNQNSAGTSGDALTLSRGGTSTTTGTDTAGEFIYGSKSLKLTFGSGEMCYGYWLWAVGGVGVNAASARVAIRIPAAPATSVDLVSIVQNGSSTKAASIRIGSDGKLNVKNAADATLYTTTSALTLPGVVQIDLTVQKGTTTSDGKVKFAVYDSAGAYTAGMSAAYENTATDTGTATLNAVNFGKLTGATWATSLELDGFASADSYALLGGFVTDPWPEWGVWNGTAEDPVQSITVWNGAAEVSIVSWARMTTAPVTPTMAGCDPIGTASYSIPGSGVVYASPAGSDSSGDGSVGNPYATLAAAIAAASAGNTIVLRAGSYPEGSAPNSQGNGVTVDKQLTIQPYPGEAVWFEGSDVFTSWAASGSAWRTAWTYTFNHSGTYSWAGGTTMVNPTYPMSRYPEQVWIADIAQTQVATLAEVVAGTFYVDEANDWLYVGSDPTLAEVRASTRCVAITVAGSGSSTTIRGIGFRRYAPQVPDQGVVKLNRGSCVLEHCQIDDSATVGVGVYGDTYNDCTVRYCTINRPGLMGVKGEKANGVIIEHCLITEANHQRFSYGQSAGGIKLTRCQTPTVRGNVIDRAWGPGIWGDQSCYDADIVSNDVTDCDGAGISYENCAVALIANNLITGRAGSTTTKGVHVLGANGVQAWNNTIAGCRETLVIQHDYRTPENTSANVDSRYDPDANQVWTITSCTARNNVYTDSANPLMRVKDDDGVPPKRDYTEFGLVLGGNLFNRVSAGRPTSLVHLTRSSGTDTYYTSLSTYQTATGLDSGSLLVDGVSAVDADYLLTDDAEALVASSGAAVALTSGVATAIGQPTGTTRVGAIRN